jgi:hypothetical protein
MRKKIASAVGAVLALAMNEKVDTFFELTLMKFSLPLMLLSALVISSCDSVDEPPKTKQRQHPAKYPPSTTQQYPPQQQPFNPNGPAQPENASPSTGSNPIPQPSAPPKVAKGDFPYGIPVPNKPHLVESPYSPGKYVDVEGFAPGTEVKDPYTGKIFLVP